MKNKKIWLLALLAIIAFAQVTVLYEFHYVETNGTFQGKAVVAILKQKYVYARVAFTLVGNGTITFSNGTHAAFGPGQLFSFTVKLPSSSYFNQVISGQIAGIDVNQSNPLVAAVITNATSSDFNYLLSSPGFQLSSSTWDDYWFVVSGSGVISIQGYGVAL